MKERKNEKEQRKEGEREEKKRKRGKESRGRERRRKEGGREEATISIFLNYTQHPCSSLVTRAVVDKLINQQS